MGAGGGDQNGKPNRTSFSSLRIWAFCLSSLLNFFPLSNSRFSLLAFSFYPRGRAGREGDDQGESYKAKVKFSAPTTKASCIVILKKGKQRPWPKCTQRNRVVDVDRSTVLGTPHSGPVRTRGLVGPVVIEAGAGNPTRESELPGVSSSQVLKQKKKCRGQRGK